MRRATTLLGSASAAFLAAFLPAAPAFPHETTVAEDRVIPSTAELPLCGDPAVLARVATNFAEKEGGYWSTGLTIVEYRDIKPLAWRPWGVDLLPRRYCTASATISDGHRRRIDYSVREGLDFLGYGWGVEFCVTGLDRNLAYTPGCRMARP